MKNKFISTFIKTLLKLIMSSGSESNYCSTYSHIETSWIEKKNKLSTYVLIKTMAENIMKPSASN